MTRHVQGLADGSRGEELRRGGDDARLGGGTGIQLLAGASIPDADADVAAKGGGSERAGEAALQAGGGGLGRIGADGDREGIAAGLPRQRDQGGGGARGSGRGRGWGRLVTGEDTGDKIEDVGCGIPGQ